LQGVDEQKEEQVPERSGSSDESTVEAAKEGIEKVKEAIAKDKEERAQKTK